MKKAISLLSVCFLLLTVSCTKDELSNDEIVSGLKEALTVGATNSVLNTNKPDGYFKNSIMDIRIPFPAEAKAAEDILRNNLGLGTTCDEFILKMNRAAENAAAKAKPIFIEAIKGITISDGLNILNGADDAATQYLKTNTENNLKAAFKPDIKAALDEAGASAVWTSLTTAYNSVPLVTPVNTDLPEYATGKALEGLFKLIAYEEKKIRQDPTARVTDVLKKVFGQLDKD